MDVNLADLCAAVADAVPDRCALVCEGQRLTYRELTYRSEQVAQHLVAAGIRLDETVGLYLPNSAAYVESLLGCMVARAIPVNINYRYTGPGARAPVQQRESRGARRGCRVRGPGGRNRGILPDPAPRPGRRRRGWRRTRGRP